MSQTKTSLFEMAEAVGDTAASARSHVDHWDREHPNSPLGPDDRWVIQARTLSTAHLMLSLMALDEDASREFVASLIKAHAADAKALIAMLTPRPKKPAPPAGVEAA